MLAHGDSRTIGHAINETTTRLGIRNEECQGVARHDGVRRTIQQSVSGRFDGLLGQERRLNRLMTQPPVRMADRLMQGDRSGERQHAFGGRSLVQAPIQTRQRTTLADRERQIACIVGGETVSACQRMTSRS